MNLNQLFLKLVRFICDGYSLKSQTSTSCFSNLHGSFVISNISEASNLNRLFLKLIWFGYNYLILDKSSKSNVKNNLVLLYMYITLFA